MRKTLVALSFLLASPLFADSGQPSHPSRIAHQLYPLRAEDLVEEHGCRRSNLVSGRPLRGIRPLGDALQQLSRQPLRGFQGSGHFVGEDGWSFVLIAWWLSPTPSFPSTRASLTYTVIASIARAASSAKAMKARDIVLHRPSRSLAARSRHTAHARLRQF